MLRAIDGSNGGSVSKGSLVGNKRSDGLMSNRGSQSGMMELEVGGSDNGSKRSCFCVLLVIFVCVLPWLVAISAVVYLSLNQDVEDVIGYCITTIDPHSCICPDDSIQPILVADDGTVKFGPKIFAPDELELLKQVHVFNTESTFDVFL